MSGKFDMGNYVDVAERIGQFIGKYPEGSLQSTLSPIEQDGNLVGWMCKARAYRTPDDPRPGVGHAVEPVPGRTPYTKDSEAMNAETSAWGRAIIALGFETKKIASRQEVQNRQGAAPQPSPAGITDEQKTEIAELVPAVAAMREVPVQQAHEAVVNEYGPIDKLTQQQAETLLGKLRRAKKNAQAKESAGAVPPDTEGVTLPSSSPTPADEPSAGESPRSGGAGSPDTEEATGAPAESLFQPPKGPRGSKAKSKAAA